ncbi:arsenate reductase ArsC [Ornithinimicrobium sp. CNJ-824]|uniref:arsenate reductase ArsC n=1 Tax=Ornithinimicrobium sp. CNJ-824 TaxID=1904966 RepID=UPI000AF27684|nr:arsenate reductase ArsC [Ornithinimicrobium sp. CNJ-824]
MERFAKEQLEARAVVEGRSAKALPELLFVCVHNAGRSQMAAAMARHHSGGRVRVRSAGSRPTGQVNPLVRQVLQERGIELTDAFPKPLTTDVLQASDVIVTMGCGDECPYFPGRRYEDWPVTDPAGAGIERVREIAADVQGRVEDLLQEILGARSGRLGH